MKLFSLLLILTIFFSPLSVKAVPVTFGGQIITFIPCTCSGGVWFAIRDVRYGYLPLVFQLGFSILHSTYTPYPSVNTLGDFIPVASICTVYSGNSCDVIPSVGTIIRMGTSLAI